MARETKAERLAREAVEEQQRLEAAKAAYPTKLMATLSRAHYLDYEIIPCEMEFTVRKEARSRYQEDEVFRVGYHFDADNDYKLDEMGWTFDALEQEKNEELRKQQVRSQALTKLSDEEKKLLGLSNWA